MIIWNQIDTVLLDMDGTLLDLHFDNYFWTEYLPMKWGEVNGLDMETARTRLMSQLQSKAGTLSWYCLDFWSGELGIDILTMKEDLRHLICERPGTLDFLQFLKVTGKQKALVTNAHQDLIRMKFACTAIGPHFDHVFCSHQFGFPKEDVRFWAELQAVYTFRPETTLLIDDNLSVLRSARDYGIRHLLTIAQPDSRHPKREDVGEFLAIESFLDLSSSEEKGERSEG